MLEKPLHKRLKPFEYEFTLKFMKLFVISAQNKEFKQTQNRDVGKGIKLHH